MVWLHEIDPIALGLGPLQIHWYGLMYLLAFGSAWMLGGYRARKMGSGWSEKQLSDLIFYCAIGVILGGRMGYVLFYHFDYFLQDPLWLFAIWEGGMSFHGGLLGVVAVILWFSRREGKTLLQLGDFVAPLVPLGLAAGRIGNFIGGELWGRATDQSWGVIFPRAGDQLARHPSQLYQATLEGALLGLILLYITFARGALKTRGLVTGVFVLGYGAARFIVEQFRQADAQFVSPDNPFGHVFLSLTMGQILSLPMVLIGAAIVLWARRQPKT